MVDLPAALAVLDRTSAAPEITAVMVGTGFPFKWYSERLSKVGLSVKGHNRILLSAACQSANEIALTILDDRLQLTARESVLDNRPDGACQILHAADFLNDTLDGPLGSDCKALKIATILNWDAVVLAKRRPGLPSAGRLTASRLRAEYPDLIDRGFERMWPDAMRVFILPETGSAPVDGSLVDECLELVR